MVAVRSQTRRDQLLFDMYFSRSKQCGLRYGSVLKNSDWVCKESQFQEYPEQRMNMYLTHKVVKKYLGLTETCVDHHDISFKGENKHWIYQSLCAMKRIPIHVIWANVPVKEDHLVRTGNLKRDDAKLPVFVFRGQNLYDIECIHPWAMEEELEAEKKAADPTYKRKRTAGTGIDFSEARRSLCYLGYNWNKKYVCQPTGFISQDLLVYSPHYDTVFITRVTDIPTSCACTLCQCGAPWRV